VGGGVAGPGRGACGRCGECPGESEASAPGLAAGVDRSRGTLVAVLGNTITLPDGSTVRGLGALARALQSNNLGNIFSQRPNLPR